MLKLTKKVNIKKWVDELNKAPVYLSDVGNEIAVTIRQTARKGVDVNGKQFKHYSTKKAWIKKPSERGKKGTKSKLYEGGYAQYKSQEYGTSSVNLVETGKMLDAITFDKIQNGIKLCFNSKTENDKAHGNQVKNGREFFGLNPQVFDKQFKPKIQKLFKF